MNCIIVRYSEIGLKGKNKGEFEMKLVNNLKFYFRKNNFQKGRIERKSSRIIIYTDENPDLSKIFGISSYSFAKKISPDIESIKKGAGELTSNFKKNTEFRVSTKRLDKNYPLSSVEIDKEIGAYIVLETGAKVKLVDFSKEIGIEIFDNHAFVFGNKQKGAGGLPVGIEGKVVALIEDDDSLEAAKLIMKRGCDICPLGFEKKDISVLLDYSPKKLTFSIIKNIKEAEGIAAKEGAKAIVVGQKLKSFKEIDTDMLVLRPLIAE